IDPWGLTPQSEPPEHRETRWEDARGFNQSVRGTWHHLYALESRSSFLIFFLRSETWVHIESRFTADGEDLDNKGQSAKQRQLVSTIQSILARTNSLMRTTNAMVAASVVLALPGPEVLAAKGLEFLIGKTLIKEGDALIAVGAKGERNVIEGERASALAGAIQRGEVRMSYAACGGGLTKGKWVKANESMSDRARSYQSQVAGRSGEAFEIGGVRFDGLSNGILVEAKGPGYADKLENGVFARWFDGGDELVSQARRQVRAADGTPIVWHVAEAEAASAFRVLFAKNNITGIQVIHVPPK
ncbi:MAG: hypothetical protein KIT68_13530, partial [Phycisphaeraceae bacterium]|nr:hypothetical protein [Phycisphaeraceae bacterium]